MKHEPKHMRKEPDVLSPAEQREDALSGIPGDTGSAHAHPLGIDMGEAVEFVPLPGDTQTNNIAVNGAVIRNPWSEQPEITPDHEYTPEQEDLNLIQL